MRYFLILLILCGYLQAAIVERYVATDGATTDAQGAYDAAVNNANACSLAVAVKYSVAGDRVNIRNGAKDGTVTAYANTTTSITTVADGTPTSPIIYRGYCTTPGDLDALGRVSGTGLVDYAHTALTFPVITFSTGRWNSGSSDNVIYQNLRIEGAYVAGTTGLLYLGAGNTVRQCSILDSGDHANAIGVGMAGVSVLLIDTDVTMTGATSTCAIDMAGTSSTVIGCRVPSSTSVGIRCVTARCIILNTVVSTTTGDGIAFTSVTVAVQPPLIYGCTIYNCGTTATTGAGVSGAAYDYTYPFWVINTHITDCPIQAFYSPQTAVSSVFAQCRFRDNPATALTYVGFAANWINGTSWGDIATDSGGIATDFTNVGSGDFSPISTYVGREKGSPLYLDIGALQFKSPTAGGAINTGFNGGFN
jgi:hypothetical protein